MIVPHMWGELIERRVAQCRYLRQKWKQNLQLWTRSAAEILIDPFPSENPSWDKGWSGYLAGKNSRQGGYQ
jgi:hypothetical protein